MYLYINYVVYKKNYFDHKLIYISLKHEHVGVYFDIHISYNNSCS